MKKRRLKIATSSYLIKKMLLTMKLTSFMLLLLLLKASAIGYAQEAKVSLNCSEQTLLKVLKDLEKQTNLYFFFNDQVLNTSHKVTIKVEDETLENVLRELLGKGYKWDIVDKLVIISLVGQDKGTSIVLRGQVRDEKDMPLPGVSVRLVGVSLGVVTDVQGWFKLELPVQKGQLEFSFVGYKKQTINFTEQTGRDTLFVTLVEEIAALEEVVVTGYQKVKTKSMAGSYSKVNAKNLVMTGTETVEQMLQGQIPGMMVVNTSGLTGTRQKVRVRGTSTLTGNAEPVWVVDGIIQQDPLPFKVNELVDISDTNVDMVKNFIGGAISWLNPRDIEDITVLKDASATAIYGVKAANGVIVITTKKGEVGRLALNYTGNFSFGEKLNYNRMELMNSQERVDLSREAYERGAATPDECIGYAGLSLAYRRREISYEEFNRKAKELEKMNTDWFDILYQTPFSHSHNVSFSGGNENSTYYASLGYSSNENTAKGNEQEVYTARLNFSSNFWNKLKVNVALSASHTETQAFASGVDPFNYALKTSRTIPCYNEDGSLLFYKHRNGYLYNILNELKQSGNENRARSMNLSVDLRWTIFDGLVFSTTFGGASSASFGKTWFTERSNHIAVLRRYDFGTKTPVDKAFADSYLPYGGLLTETENENINYTWRGQFEFIKNFHLHSLNLMLGVEVGSNKQDGSSHTTYGYMPDRGETFVDVPSHIGSYDNPYARVSPKIINSLSNTLSYYLSGNYMYDNRYALNFSVRNDGSNRFGQNANAKFQPVWSLGVRWNVTDEHWMENQGVFNNLSFSATFGYQGNVVDAVSPDLVARMEPIDAETGEYRMSFTKLPTPDLKWEKTRSVNLGMGFSVLNSKINGSFEYYYKKTSDLITNREVADENGVTTMYVNGGNMRNSGWDLSFSVVPVRTKDFMWNIGFNTSKVYNEIESTLGATGNWREVTDGTFNKAGYPVSSFWAFRFVGLHPENGGPLFDLSEANTNAAELDVTRYMVYAGKLDPDLTAGINMNFRYKQWTLATSFYLSTGNQAFLDSPYTSTLGIMPSEYENASTQLVDRWRKPGDVSTIPSIPVGENCAPIYPFKGRWTALYPYEAWSYSDVRVVDAWYLRCSNLTLSYVFPEKLVGKFAQNVSCSFTVSNPFQIVSSDFDGRDPEVAKGEQPLSRNFSFSVNVSF